MSDLRATMMADEDLIASKSRFGLFSQPAPLAIGDDSPYKSSKRTRGENGKPITSPPQMLSGLCRSGVQKSSYFQVPESIYQKDQYKEQFKLELQYDKKMHSKYSFHENDFKPASGSKTLDKASYNYIAQNPQTNKKARRNADGRVVTQPRNFTTNPMSKVQNEFFKQPKHMADPYERKNELEKKDRLAESKKITNQTFAKDLISYGEDNKVKQLLTVKKQRAKTETSTKYPHESSFRPAIKNSTGTIGKFPQHMSMNALDIKLDKKKANQSLKKADKQIWKSNGFQFSRPTPSVTMHHQNILRSFRCK